MSDAGPRAGGELRVVVVSAHYPPNFVSGGTLVPQRLARGLAARGHDVRVYAGWLDLDGSSDRQPLESWTEPDGDVSVRWIVTTPFIGWADDRNWRNREVTDNFAAWLGTIKPDIVHLHSLQSLGADLVAVAADSGARVVVTMHDFWWCCGRQFLVDRTVQPCSLVVDAGVCECEVDHRWLERRDRELRGVLARADLVLAPSAGAVAVLAANGVNPARLRVDENGLPAAAATQESGGARDDVGDVRFTYAGGSDRMKGVHVLVDAARQLASSRPTGWSLRAYGAGRFLADEGIDIAGLPVTAPPPYPPDALDDVLASTDVLVLPSVMRETHSILTREALLRGVTVIATDSIGPEEVVSDGQNGLIVPSGDATALAEAMARLVGDAGLRARLLAGTRERPVTVRSVAAQVAGLERTYRDLLAEPPAAPPTTTSFGRVVFMVGIEGAPLRYRARLPAEGLALLGVASDVRYYRDDSLPALVDAADALVVYRVPATVQVLALIERAKTRGIPVIFDVDDLIFDPDLEPEIPAVRLLPRDEAALWMEGVRRYRTTMEACDGYIGSTPMLVRHARGVTGLPVAQFDNGVGVLLGRRSDAALRAARTPGPLRIGYLSGTTTHDEDWYFVEPAVVRVLDAHPDVELWLGGHLPTSAALERFGERVRRLPFTPWNELPHILRDLDVNLAPLAPDSRFNEAKSAIKWLEAALTETVTVASPTEPFRDAVNDGVNGLLAGTEDQWFAAIDQLLRDHLRRTRLATRARRDALLRWSPHLQGRRYLEILERAREWRDTRRATSWPPVVHDEPLVPHRLEPYTDEATWGPAPAPTPTSPSLPEKLRHSIATRGAVGTVRHLPRWAWAALVAIALVLLVGAALLRPGGRIAADRMDHTVSTGAALAQFRPGEPVVQTFVATADGLSAVSARFGTFVRRQPCTIDVRLDEEGGGTLDRASIACADIPDAVATAVVTLAPQPSSAGRQYTLTITMRPERAAPMVLYGVVASPDRPPARQGGETLPAALEVHTDYGHFPHAYDEIGTALRRIQQYGSPWHAPAVVVLLAAGALALLVALVAAPRRWGLLLLVAFALAKGTLWSVITPPLEGVDEPAHVSYVQFMSADHAVPRRGDNSRADTTVSAELHVAVDVFHTLAIGRDDRPDFGPGATGPDAYRLDEPLSQHANGNGSAAGYSPAYYAVPALLDAISPGSIDVRIGVMRLWSVALGSLTVIGAVLIGRRLFPGRESLALLLGAAIALLPMLSQQTAIVNNDALVIAGGAWCLVAAIELTRPQRWRWLPLASGFVLGVAILGKPQALVWAPVLAIGWAIGGWRAGRAQRWLFDAGTAVAGVVLSYGPWLVASKAFDYPGVGIAPGEVGPHRGLVDFLHVLSENQFLAVRRTWIRQFWGEFSWIDVSYSDSVYRVILVAVLIGVVVVLAWAVRTMSELVRGRAWRRLELDDGDAAGVVCVVAILGTMAELYLLAFEYFHRTGRNDFLQGRYALMAAVAVLLLPVLALRKLVPRLSPAVPLAVTATAMAVLNVAGLGLLVERFYL